MSLKNRRENSCKRNGASRSSRCRSGTRERGMAFAPRLTNHFGLNRSVGQRPPTASRRDRIHAGVRCRSATTGTKRRVPAMPPGSLAAATNANCAPMLSPARKMGVPGYFARTNSKKSLRSANIASTSRQAPRRFTSGSSPCPRTFQPAATIPLEASLSPSGAKYSNRLPSPCMTTTTARTVVSGCHCPQSKRSPVLVVKPAGYRVNVTGNSVACPGAFWKAFAQ